MNNNSCLTTASIAKWLNHNYAELVQILDLNKSNINDKTKNQQMHCFLNGSVASYGCEPLKPIRSQRD